MNRKHAFFATTIFAFAASFAAEPWEDPDVNEINRLPPRAISIPCETEDLAFDILRMDRPKGDSRWVISLNGTWDFRWKRSTATPDWEKSAQVAVPGCWQLQGEFDPPLYTNSRYPIAKDAPRVTKEPGDKNWTAFAYRNPVALYTTKFKRPWRWWFRRTILHFDGVSAAFRVRVNGNDVGYAEDSRLPSEFDLTPYLNTFCSNTIEVEVYKHCDGTYLEDQDFWRLSGIFRDVYVVSEDNDAPYDIIVDTQLSDDMKSGKFVVRDEKGNAIKIRDVPDVKLWNPEKPYLYMTPLEHKWGWMPFEANKGWWIFGGIDYRAVTFGFRKLEIRDSVLYMNGKRVVFKGVNRHEMEPGGGYVVTIPGMTKDVALMKTFNINAVRTCHYPDVPEWYDICDRDGVMVVCEANVESHGYGYGKESLAKRKDYEKSHVERNVRMVRTFRNHPSIVMWSMGNEAGDGPNFEAAYKAIKAIDTTRPVHYERAATGAAHTDVDSEMYTRPWNVEKLMKAGPKKPFVLCEYLHAMGNSNGSVDRYMDLVNKYPSFQGGFVWDFADQAIWKSDGRGRWLAYGGDFGDLPNDGNFNCNGLFDALRNPHPGAFEVKYAYRSIFCESFDFETGKVRIRNGYDVLSLDEFDCRWHSLDANGEPAAKGWIDLGEVPPGETREYELKDFRGDSVIFQFHDGRSDIAWGGFAKPFRRPDVAAATGDSPFRSRLRLNLWRAPTDNDRGWNMAEVCRVWKDATATQNLPAGVKSDLKTSALADGSVLVDWTFVVPEGLPPIPRVGLTFTVPKAQEASWFGLGPWENYADRSTSAMLGSYKAQIGFVPGIADPAKGTILYPRNPLNPDNYIEPGEQGYRTGVRRLEVGAVRIDAVEAPFGFNVWPYPQTMLEGKTHQWEMSEAEELTVNVDAVQMGVGGDNSWGARPHGEFMPGAGTYRLVFTVKGI